MSMFFVCVCMCACMDACMSVCVCMHVWEQTCVCVCMHVYFLFVSSLRDEIWNLVGKIKRQSCKNLFTKL